MSRAIRIKVSPSPTYPFRHNSTSTAIIELPPSFFQQYPLTATPPSSPAARQCFTLKALPSPGSLPFPSETRIAPEPFERTSAKERVVGLRCRHCRLDLPRPCNPPPPTQHSNLRIQIPTSMASHLRTLTYHPTNTPSSLPSMPTPFRNPRPLHHLSHTRTNKTSPQYAPRHLQLFAQTPPRPRHPTHPSTRITVSLFSHHQQTRFPQTSPRPPYPSVSPWLDPALPWTIYYRMDQSTRSLLQFPW